MMNSDSIENIECCLNCKMAECNPDSVYCKLSQTAHENNDTGSAICIKCGILLDISNFKKTKGSSRSHTCNACVLETRRKNAEKRKQDNKQARYCSDCKKVKAPQEFGSSHTYCLSCQRKRKELARQFVERKSRKTAYSPPDMSGTRTCAKCGKEKDISEFYWRPIEKIFRKICKECYIKNVIKKVRACMKSV